MRRRIYITYSIIVTLLIGIFAKIVLISADPNVHAVGITQGRRTVSVASVRGTIYDRNLVPMVNQNKQYYASFIPQRKRLDSLKSCLSEENYRLLLEKAKEGVPLSIQLESPIVNNADILTFRIPTRYDDYCPSPQLLGYLDNSGQSGLSGIERAYNDVLRSHSGSVEVTYEVNGSGSHIDQSDITINNTVSNSKGGVALTLDLAIQNAIDDIAYEHLDKGAIVVLDAKTGDILAMGSYPTFHPENLKSTITENNGALINRALSLYDCGSIFKIVTSIAALENGIPAERCYHCSGEITVDGTVFHCHNRDGHGALNMKLAFAKSCNAYYIQLAQEIGAATLMKTINDLGFCEEIHLAKGISAPPSVLPNIEDLSAPAALANLSFGQGKLLISPLQAARLTSVMTANGTLLNVGAIRGLVKNNNQPELLPERGGETVISAATVAHMRTMMQAVVTEGTGIAAQSPLIDSAGKTGTAETGQVNTNGMPVIQSWFTGYFPAIQPQYVVTVLAEDAQNTGNQATKVFCEISNKLI